MAEMLAAGLKECQRARRREYLLDTHRHADAVREGLVPGPMAVPALRCELCSSALGVKRLANGGLICASCSAALEQMEATHAAS